MVGAEWLSMVGAVMTSLIMAIFYNWGIKRKWLLTVAKEPKKQRVVLGSLLVSLVLIGVAHLFCHYGYGFWKQEKYFVILCGVLLAAFADQKERRIPNQLLLILFGWRIVILLAEILTWPSLWSDFVTHVLYGAAGSFLLMLVAWYLSKKAVGIGDVKLLTVTGLFLGFSLNYIVLFLGLLLAAGCSLIKVLKKQIKIKDEVAFAPFIAAGVWIALLLGM